MFLNLGKTDGFYTNQIIDLVNRNLRKERIQIGRIDLMQNFSFFEVIQEQALQVMKALNKVVLSGGRKVCVEIAGENTGKSDKSGKKKKMAVERKTDKASKVEKSKSLVGKKEDMSILVAQRRKTTGNSSFSKTINCFVEKNQISQKKAGQNVANGKMKNRTDKISVRFFI